MALHPDASIVILTALSVEYQAVRRRLRAVQRVDHPAGTVFETGELPDGSGRVAVGVTGEGNTAAAVLAERAITTFRPRALLFVGVAGALTDDLELGDVVVATKVYAYHGGKEQPDGFRPRPRSWQVSHQLDQVARHVYHVDRWSAGLDRRPAVHFRPIAAGEVVLNGRGTPLFEHLRHTYGDAAAIEMESAGVTQAGHLNDALPVLTIRAISDKADGGKQAADAEGWQPLAADHAATFAVAVAAEVCGQPAARWRSAGRTAVPRQLPVRSGLLVGRAAHLDRLDTALLAAEGVPRIAVLTGMAGSGKTALAVEWAHRAADAFPDGVLYADARGFGPDTPSHPREILADFLRALGQVRAAEQGSLDERAASLRTTLAGRRMLIVVDNAGSVDQVRPLLPGTESSAVLVTSRESLRGLAVHHAAQMVEIEPLARKDAIALLDAAIGPAAAATPEEAAQLAARCADLPLALRIAAEMVSRRPHRDLAALLADLDEADSAVDILDTGDDPYSAVRTVFSWSYQALPDDTAAAFRLLGLHPGSSFGVPAAAALLDSSSVDTRRTLRSLTNAHLLTEVAPDRFAIHDLLRAYVRQLVDAEDPNAALRRLFDQYLHAADAAGRLVMPHRHRESLQGHPAITLSLQDRAAAVRWFDLERHNLVEMCRLDEAEFDVRRWHLAYILRDYFYVSKYLDGWLETHSLALAGCLRLGDRRAEGMTRNNYGRALLESGRMDAAADQYRWAHAASSAAGDEHGMTDALVNLASVQRRRGEYAEALQSQRAALAFYRRAGLSRKIGITLRSIGRTELAQGRLTQAAATLDEALGEFTALGLELDAAQSLTTLGQIHHRAGAYDQAEVALRQAIDYSRRSGSTFEEAKASHLLGAVYADRGDIEAARDLWEHAMSLFGRLGARAADAVRDDLLRLTTAAPRR